MIKHKQFNTNVIIRRYWPSAEKYLEINYQKVPIPTGIHLIKRFLMEFISEEV